MTESVNILTNVAQALHEDDSIGALIARRINQLRKELQLSCDELSARSGVSKGMVVQIEQGRANPSIGILTKLAASLRISVADLLREDARSAATVRISQVAQSPVLWRGPKGGSATLLAGSDGPHMVELWEWVLYPGESYEAKPHPKGTIELFRVLDGTLILEVGGHAYVVGADCTAVARTESPHAYRNQGRGRTRFTMVVHEPPAD
jgi:transcriptional regulator with XRE-family HTH domain